MITLKKILVPTDLSDLSVPAVGYALSLAKFHGAEVSLLHVVPNEAMRQHFADRFAPGGLAAPAEAPIGAVQQPNLEELFERKKRVIHNFLEQRIAPELARAVKANGLVKIGKVTDEIIFAAKEEQADLIVMTSHAGRLRRLLRGGFTDRVILSAPCPVLLIPPWAEIRMEENKRVPAKLIDKWAA